METLHIALTGHRPTKLGGYNINTPQYLALQKDLEQFITHHVQQGKIVHCHSGLALGADTIWSKAILAVRAVYPKQVVFHADVPMKEQSNAWFKSSDVEFWQHQISVADHIHLYGSLENCKDDNERRKLAVKFLYDRNDGMIGAADIVVAVHDGSKGGTHHAVTAAKNLGKEVVTVDPAYYFG